MFWNKKSLSILLSPFLYGFFSIVSRSTVFFNRMDKAGNILQGGYGGQTFDFIVVGAGSAGCVVANRLSKKYKVLLIEEGGEQQPPTYVPGLSFAMLNREHIDHSYKTVPQNNTAFGTEKREMRLAAGRGLGGSSFLNFLTYERGNPLDFDNWAEITGDESWSYDNLIPHFKAIENFHGDYSKDGLHGIRGEMPVKPLSFEGLSDIFVKAGIEQGWSKADLNSNYSQGFSPAYENQLKGRRMSSYSAFIHPIRRRDTLKISKFSQVQKILFHTNTTVAYGVQYLQHGELMEAYAAKEVIISAGAIGSPKLLMLSGIGPQDHLEDLNITSIRDLPVGQGIQDHLITYLGPFYINQSLSILRERDMTKKSLFNYLFYGRGPYSSSGIQAIASIVSSTAESSGEPDWPDIHLLLDGTAVFTRIDEYFNHAYGIERETLRKYYDESTTHRDSFHILVSNSRPTQTGEIYLRTNNPTDPPIIDPKYLENDQDLEIMVEGMKLAVDLVENSTVFQQLDEHFTTKKFPGCDEIEFRTDEYWECYARYYSVSHNHIVGSCQMGKMSSLDAVVDTQLKVIGTKRLRVIDASVMPRVPSCSTNAPTMMIGQKGATMILDFWREEQSNFILGN